MPKYIYNGPVMLFEACLADRWRAETYAPSEKKARSNFAHQYKKLNGFIPRARIACPGEIKKVKD